MLDAFFFFLFYQNETRSLELLSVCHNYSYNCPQGIVSHECSSYKVPLLLSTVAHQLFLSGILNWMKTILFLLNYMVFYLSTS